MGRGRGRGGGGGGGSRGRGRGGGRGGGHKKRWEHKANDKKEASHLKQFGEIHPSQNMQDFGPSASKKFKSFEKSHHHHNNGVDKVVEDTSESDSEEESTPYNELLTLFSGQKNSKQVQILSESEDESDSEQDDDNDDDEELLNARLSESDDEEVPGAPVLDGDTNALADDSDLSESESEEGLPQQEPSEVDDDGIELPDETVIAEAEIDPDESDESNMPGKTDPFLLHFECELQEELRQSLIGKEKLYNVHSRGEFPIIERYQFSGIEDTDPKRDENSETLKILQSALEKRKCVQLPKAPIPTKSLCRLENLHLKPQLVSRIGMANQECLDKESCSGPLTPFQSELLFISSQYHDFYFPERTMDNQEAIRVAYCVHAANHILKTRTRILHHNAKMATKIEVPEEYRDQGFVRPKVLILVPFKESALRIVKILISLILEDEKGNVANKKRFVDEYSGTTLFMPKTNPKPEDYMATFAGNTDDDFRLGMSITKKSIKLFTDFYSSDIIIASPVALRRIVGAEGEKGRDYDFLSSIEVAILDQADVFLMQNWDHVLHLMKHLNLQPVTTHGTDFGRIRPWAVDGLSKQYRQTLVFSSVNCPEHNALFSRNCKNFAGLIKTVNPILKGSICQVTVQLPQVYQQFDSPSLQEINDSRFNYFTSKVLPNFSNRLMSQTLIFVSSYFDFVRLRNHFKREELSFVQICEYTKDKKIARSRDLFFHNENHFLLYTERAMFFRRLRLKGIGHIIFYQLPQYPQLYSELCNFVQEGFQSRRVRQRKNSSVTAIYCKYDAPRLAGIVGSDRASHMLSSDKKVHAFVTGELT